MPQRNPNNKDPLGRSREESVENPVAGVQRLCERCDWEGAYEALRAADERGLLDARGLELLADCTRWVGKSAEVAPVLERAHAAYGDEQAGAARTALGLCYAHMDVCEPAQAAGWWRRADELIASLPEGPEHGLHAWFAGRECGANGDLEGHEAHARRTLEIGQRFRDSNVEALGLIDLAHVATVKGRSSEARGLLDRATALALGGRIGILETGLVFCNAIFACRARGDWGRAQEWTESSSRWVSRVQVSYFPGLCRVHRAEVLRIRGELEAAEAEALEAARLLRQTIPRWLALAKIELGDIRRRLGDFTGALEACQQALEAGWDPQPGLALLLLAQGDPCGAHRALERFANSRQPTLLCEDRSGLLRARVSIAIAAGELGAAESAAAELRTLAAGDSVPWDVALSSQSDGELAFAQGDVSGAIADLQRARSVWATLDAPFELADCTRSLGGALAAGEDAVGAGFQLKAAAMIFERIGARHERENCEALLTRLGASGPGPSLRGSAPPDSSATASLRREGDVWAIQFGGGMIRVKDAKGPKYLARLLSEPGRDILALDLTGGSAMPTGDAGEALDAQARAAYRGRLSELRADLDEAVGDNDLARVAGLREEMEMLTSELSKAVGLSGRGRRVGDPLERARQSVTKALRAVIRKIAGQNEALGRYLSDTIRTGTACRFDPDPGRPVRWRVDF